MHWYHAQLTQVHPRVSGVLPEVVPVAEPVAGSSPRERGFVESAAYVARYIRFIPA